MVSAGESNSIMTDDEPTLSVTAGPEQTAAVAAFVTNLLAGKIDCGDGTSLVGLSLPFDFSVRKINHGVRLTIKQDVEIDRPGVNPWLEYLDLHSDGVIVARLRKVGFSFDYRVR